MVNLHKQGDVFVLEMNAGENRVNDGFLSAYNRALDEVEAFEGQAALVTVGTGKFYSNGLDLEWMMGPECGDPQVFVERLHALFGRLLGFPRPTVAALNGHTFAAGAMLALCHDFRIARSDRGYFCLPEVDINIPFTPPMMALIKSRLSPLVAHEACVTGRRYAAADMLQAGIASDACPEAEVLPRAVARAADLAGKNPGTLSAIKRTLFASTLDLLGSRAR